MNKSSSIYAIPLPRDPEFSDYPVHRVFLIAGEKNILVDSGHAAQWEVLEKALNSLELCPEDISEIYYTSQSFDSVGNRKRFPKAVHFATSKPHGNEKIDGLLDLIAPHLHPAVFDAIRTFVRVPDDNTEITPIHDGDTVLLNETPFDVVSTGSRTLFLSEQFSFVGEVAMGETPPLMPDSDDLQRIVSRAQNLAEGVVYSTFRAPYEDAAWFFKQTQRAFQAFQQSAKLDDVSLDEFCKRDLGGVPDDAMFWALYLLKYAPFFLSRSENEK